MNILIVFYALGIILSVVTVAITFRIRQYTTCHYFLLHLLIPSGVSAIYLFFCELLQLRKYEATEILYNLTQNYAAFQYEILGNLFLMLTYYVHKNPVAASRLISKQRASFNTAQMVTVVLSVVVRIDLDLCKKMLEPKSFTQRLIMDLSYNLPCLVGTVILFISYTACIHQLVTYRSKALSRQQARKKKQVLGAVLFFTPVTLVYIVNFADFGIVILRDALIFIPNDGSANEVVKFIKEVTDPYVFALYALQIVVFPVCALFAFKEYRKQIRRWMRPRRRRNGTRRRFANDEQCCSFV